ncbi:MAG: hypothetical protein AAGF84_08690 [Planctomycetota bacterium]
MRNYLRATSRTVVLCFLAGLAYGVQAVEVRVQPEVTRGIGGEVVLDRNQYFAIADTGGLYGSLSPERFDRYINELEITFGRHVNMLNAAWQWEGAVREDPENPGKIDLAYLAENAPLKDGQSTGAIRQKFDKLEIVGTENFVPNVWPPFMETYVHPEDTTAHQPFPVDVDHAALATMTYVKHAFSDWARPKWFEGINEPGWFFNGKTDPKFYEFHLKLLEHARALGLDDMKVGGPCFPTVQHWKDNYQNLLSGMGRFIDGTNAELDFYSFHPYNYMTWSEELQDFDGRITAGPPIDGVVDALVNFGVNRYGKELKLVVSEHGAYVEGPPEERAEFDKLVRRIHPDLEGWEYEMARRAMANFIMVNGAIMHTFTFMDHPHVVEKSIPYLITETSSWQPKHNDVLLVSKDFKVPVEEWVEGRGVDFWEFFKDVRGRRVAIDCPDLDVQHQAFVDDDTLILLFNNIAWAPQPLDITIEGDAQPTRYTVRKHGRDEFFAPYLTEEVVASLDGLVILPYESVAVFAEYAEDVSESRAINEVAYFGDAVAVELEGQDVLRTRIALPEIDNAEYATLRIAVGRPNGTDRDLAVRFNGKRVRIPVEDAADRLDATNRFSKEYGTLKKARIPVEWLRENNRVEIAFPDGKGGGVGSVVLRVAHRQGN